jgi:1-acyl-sn-glycerol-3-phosphate acyltransferase
MSWFGRLARFVTRVLLVTLTRWRVEGKENIPRTGPLLVVVNHINLADPPIIATSLRRPTFFMAKDDLWRSGFSRWVVSNFGAFPVRRGAADRGALRQTCEIMSRGSVVVIFPEATRSRDHRLQPAYPGAAMVARLSGAPVLPVGLTGTEVISWSFWWLKRPRITVKIGPTFKLPSFDGKVSKDELAQQTEHLMSRLADLLPESYGGTMKQ